MTYPRQARCRWHVGAGQWEVRGRVERLVEPAVLLLLAERPRHGYQLLEELSGLIVEEAVLDAGNLYRLMRGLEGEGFVVSSWRTERGGPAAHLPAHRGRSGPAGTMGDRVGEDRG